MAVHVERVDRVRVRLRPSRPSRGLMPEELVGYAVSGLVGILIGAHATGPLLARWLLGG